MEFTLTLAILVVTVITSLIANGNNELYYKLMFNSYQVAHRKEWYRLITHAFIHSKENIFHLVVNMYVFYSFGKITESFFVLYRPDFGKLMYLSLYIGAVIASSIPSLIKHKDNYNYNAVGASGAVSAVLFSSIAFLPIIEGGGINLMFIPIDIPPIIFGIAYLAYEAYMSKRSNDNVAHDAHFWGAIFGIAYTFLVIPESFTNFFAAIFG